MTNSLDPDQTASVHVVKVPIEGFPVQEGYSGYLIVFRFFCVKMEQKVIKSAAECSTVVSSLLLYTHVVNIHMLLTRLAVLILLELQARNYQILLSTGCLGNILYSQ